MEGQKIKNTADNVGIIGSFGALVLGVVFWGRADDLLGFLVGLGVVGVGIAGSFILMCLLYKYGDMVNSAIKQAEELLRLEMQKNEEMLRTAAAEVQQQQAEEAEPMIQEVTVDISPTEQGSVEQNATEDEFSADERGQAEVRKRSSELPLQADAIDRIKRVAHFYERSDSGVICPVCTKWQTAKNNACFHCNCKFVFDDELQNKEGMTA